MHLSKHFYIGVLTPSTLVGGSKGKESACNEGDLGSIPELGRSPGEGNGNPLQYPSLGNPMDREAWWAIVRQDCKESDVT